MFSWLNQIAQISAMNLRNIPARWGASLVIVIGIAGVVGVFTAIFAMNEGFRTTLGKTGQHDRIIVLRGGATSELSSGISREQADLIAGLPGIGRDSANRALASSELIVIAELPKTNGLAANTALRGVHDVAFAVRPEVKIVAGRRFAGGRRELIVGKQAQRQFKGLAVGARVTVRELEWTIVGVFEANGGVHESELWADAETVQSAYRRDAFQSVTAALAGPSGLDEVRLALEGDARLQVKVQTLDEYFAAQSQALATLIKVLGYAVAAIMSVGAVFGALNTMYTAIATRGREIATLRALGFGATPVVLSVMAEALALSLLGAGIGAALAYALFNGYSAATLGANFSQVAFDFRVTTALMARGVVLAACIGLIGGLLPAWRAGRMALSTALRSA